MLQEQATRRRVWFMGVCVCVRDHIYLVYTHSMMYVCMYVCTSVCMYTRTSFQAKSVATTNS